jgi:hypothetical protein
MQFSPRFPDRGRIPDLPSNMAAFTRRHARDDIGAVFDALLRKRARAAGNPRTTRRVFLSTKTDMEK